MSNPSHYLLLDRIEIESANAISSPLTYGFPAISGFLGAVHALNRKLVEAGITLDLSGVLIACHDIQVQRYRPHAYTDYSFNQSRNPIKKDGKTASIIEEGKVHLTVSLVVEVSASRKEARDIDDDIDHIEERCRQIIFQQRMAGGSVRSIKQVRFFNTSDGEQIKRSLLPAFVLMDAKKDLVDITRTLQESNPEANSLDALIEVATLHHVPVETKVSKSGWQTQSPKTGRGWLVPMPVGYQALSPKFDPGQLQNCRTVDYPSHYVEALYSLGKWLFPNRLPNDLSSCFWRYSQSDNLYLMTQTSNGLQGE
ncbi:type I-F CRISPR-associated protein Csy2 [Amphritea pacifica]|uniref:type I-F CRISPR-associated protein Csy2 n=1 Tax=Amphritea pacifica TaxID=2811233 RepID=UPI0019649A3B|nr:type I-F CRISPR-associated protein Csy2 [Amphritea pacifica]MBN1007479.1 type I-F CRISPR-associated protein Csy2 [Amphritea pacifica]